MPYMNGFEVCRHLKAQKETKFIPVVMLTALDSIEDKVRVELRPGRTTL